MIKKIVAYLSLALCIMVGALFALHHHRSHAVIPQYEKKLSKIAHDRVTEINAFLAEQEKNAAQLAQETIMQDALQKIIEDETGKTALNTFIESHKEKMSFNNILLIDNKGVITFATIPTLIGQNITPAYFAQSALSDSYERAIMTLTNDFSYLRFNKLIQENALFISVPVLKNKKFLGALAYQINQEKIYQLAHQYIDLQKTGDIALAYKDEAFAILLSPTRNDPDASFKKIALFTDIAPAIQPAVLGQVGSGIAQDHRGKKIVGSWNFIPKVDWGILVSIDYDEIIAKTDLTKNILMLFCILFIISLLMLICLYYHSIRHTLHVINTQPPCNKIPASLKKPSFILLLIFLALALKNSLECSIKKSAAIANAKHRAEEICVDNSDAIETILKKIAFIGQSINDDLRTHYLAVDDIGIRMKRDCIETNPVNSITVFFLPDKDVTSNVYTLTQATNSYDTAYSKKVPDATEVANIQKASWYLQATEHGPTWIIHAAVNPSYNQITDYKSAIYACPLIDDKQKIYGAIAINFSLEEIINTTQYKGIGQTGYSIILAQDGSFIFHPTQSVIQEEKTILQYAQSKGNSELATIAEKIVAQAKPFIGSYSSESEKETFWICTQPVKINNWIVGSLFSEDEVGLGLDIVRHYYFWTLIWLTIALLLLCAVLYSHSIISLTMYAIVANIILLAALMHAWHSTQTVTSIDRESRAIITDQSNLNKFLNSLYEESSRKHETTPVSIPCGILLTSMSITDPDHIAISGYVWNKYNSEQNDIRREMRLPQASKVTFGTPTKSVAGQEETVTWSVQAILYQEQNYTKYPFDQLQLKIILEHTDIEKNTLLTPDLVSYKKLSPESMPGLDKEFMLAGFTVEQTFFEYHKIEPTTNYGLQDFGKVTDNYQLVYNVILDRNLLNPFVLYLIPLLVILFSLFSTLLVEELKTEPLSLLGGYTGLFFALIVLQRSLREQHPTGNTLYLEYAFFYTYVTIILLIIHTIIMYYYKNWESYQKKSLYFMRILFWPFQLISWLVTTLIIFY